MPNKCTCGYALFSVCDFVIFNSTVGMKDSHTHRSVFQYYFNNSYLEDIAVENQENTGRQKKKKRRRKNLTSRYLSQGSGTFREPQDFELHSGCFRP